MIFIWTTHSKTIPHLNFFEILGDFFEKSLEYYLGLDNSIAAIHFVNNLTQVNED